GSFQRQGNTDRPRACANVQDNVSRPDAGQRSLDQMLSLRSGNQNIRRHAKFAAIEFLTPGNVLRRLALQPLVQIAAIVQPCYFTEWLLRMRVQIRALAPKRVN